MRSISCMAGIAAAFAFAALTFAQNSTNGSITVAVSDTTGAVIPGAEISVHDIETNDTRKGATTTGGVFSFPDLPFGNYRVSISKEGFAAKTYESVQVQTGRVTDLKVTLAVGSTTTAVTVSG